MNLNTNMYIPVTLHFCKNVLNRSGVYINILYCKLRSNGAVARRERTTTIETNLVSMLINLNLVNLESRIE